MADHETLLAEAAAAVPVGSRWKHYRGAEYLVVGHTLSVEMATPLVLYRRLECYGITWARPLESWQSQTDSGPRFTRVDTDA